MTISCARAVSRNSLRPPRSPSTAIGPGLSELAPPFGMADVVQVFSDAVLGVEHCQLVHPRPSSRPPIRWQGFQSVTSTHASDLVRVV
jgi:hypothetical protein